MKVETAVATTVPDPWEEVSDPDLGRWPRSVLKYKSIIISAAGSYNVEPKLMTAVIYIESWFPKDWADGWILCPDGPNEPSCTSGAGAIGIAQVMPINFKDGEDGRDPTINISRGTELLREYMNDFGGDVRSGLAAYNCGPNRLITESPAICWKYAKDVLHEYSSR